MIQASKDKEKWQLVGAFRQLKGTQSYKFDVREMKAYKFWRYVVVDHSGKPCRFSSIEWFVKGHLKRDHRRRPQIAEIYTSGSDREVTRVRNSDSA